MKSAFLKKYRDYCGPKDSQNDIFKMQKHEDESIEDFLERFNFVLQKSKYNTLQEDAVRTLFLKGILEEYVEILNLMASRDVSHKSFEEITKLCRKYSRSRAEAGKNVREGPSRTSGTTGTSGVTRTELGNLLENFKTNILGTLSSQFDGLKTKKRQ